MTQSMRKGWAYALVALLLLMAGFKFVRQDIWYLNSAEVKDYLYFYLPGHAWLEGKQPYSRASLKAIAVEVYGPQDSYSHKNIDSLYPPTAFLALLPLLVLPHQVLPAAVLALSLGAYVWLAWLLARGLAGAKRALFMAFALNYAPLHSGLRPENVTVLVAALLLLPLLAAVENRFLSPWWFTFLGLGVAIKPQLGIPFLLLVLVMREWTRFLVALSTVVTSVVLSVGWLALNGVHWVTPFLMNLRQGPSATDEASATTVAFAFNGAANFRLIDLSPLVYLFSGNAWLSVGLPPLVACGCLLCLLVMLGRGREGGQTSPAAWNAVFGVCGAIALLGMYSRYYGAILLLPVFAWLWNEGRRPALKVFLWVGAVIFSLPTPQFPAIWQAAVVYFQHPETNLSQGSSLLTAESFFKMRPAGWQEWICALPNLYLFVVCAVVLALMARRSVTTPPGVYGNDP